jgi:hypothetical protein
MILFIKQNKERTVIPFEGGLYEEKMVEKVDGAAYNIRNDSISGRMCFIR